jgi:hypothetical protein
MKYFYLFIFFSFFSSVSYSQLYQGPAFGSVNNGAIVSTDNFLTSVFGDKFPDYLKKPVRNKIPFKPYPDINNIIKSSAPYGSNNYIDPKIINKNNTSTDPVIIRSFLGFLDPGGYIPPDFYLAVGPTHIMGVDNGRFRIWEKNGRLVKTIMPEAWFSTALVGANPFDPKVLYDNLSKRWIMVWLDQKDSPQRGYFLISVSKDSIPLGTWYNWAIPSNVNGSVNSGGWGDYQGVGFDENTLYITANQFAFAGYFQGSRIRIIPKSQLYSNTAGPLGWTDLWDIREPSNTNMKTFGVRPTICHSPVNSQYFLVCMTPYYPSKTNIIVYKIDNPLNNPVMTGVNIPVTTFYDAPNANQLGGSSIGIEAGGSDLRNEPIFKNGQIYGVHSVKFGTSYSAVSYFRLNPYTNNTLEDVAMGADGFWHFYCSIGIDKDSNIAITYSRSGLTEYIGAFFTSRLNSDPLNTLSGSHLIQNGKANYVKDFGSGRNRWGDYNGIWIDPADANNFWALTEYAEAPVNTWAGIISNFRLIPFNGPRVRTSKDTLNFGTVEINHNSDTVYLDISNLGNDTLLISQIQFSNPEFHLTGNNSFPVKLGFNQTRTFGFLFSPVNTLISTDSINIVSNDLTNTKTKISVVYKPFKIVPAVFDSVYAISGPQSNGSFISINKTNGLGNIIGPSGFTEIKSLSIRYSDNVIFGCISDPVMSKLYRINSQMGDAYLYKKMPLPNIRTIAFDMNDDLYCASGDGLLFKYNLISGDTSFIGSTGINSLYGLAINPQNGNLWGVSLYNKIYKIDKLSGQSIQIGIPGFTITPSIAFSQNGELYGLSGIGILYSALIKYDTSNGTAVSIGNTGIQSLNALVITSSGATEIPLSYNLYQNYPNPFNAGTTIAFDIPVYGKVSLNIYDVIGRLVMKVFNQNFSPGSYKYKITSDLPSGIYFYRLKTPSFNLAKKMLIIK